MGSDREVKREHPAASASSAEAAQVGRMRAAIDRATAVGPSFLRGDVDAARMANTMVDAVSAYFESERAAGGGAPRSAEARELEAVLTELMGCGSGYLAGRCDAACVARTMTEMVHQFRPA